MLVLAMQFSRSLLRQGRRRKDADPRGRRCLAELERVSKTLPQNRREDVGPFHRRAEEPKLDSVVWHGGPSSE